MDSDTNSSLLATFQFTSSGRVIVAGNLCKVLFGCDLVGDSVYDLVADYDNCDLKALLAKSILKRKNFVLKTTLQGSETEFSVRPLYDKDQFICFIASSRVGQSVENSSLSELIVGIGHDLKTPLNSVLGFASLLGESRLCSESGEYVRAIESSGRDLLLIISDLVELAKIESGKITLDREWCSVDQLVKELQIEAGYRNGKTGSCSQFLTVVSSDYEFEADGTRLKKLISKLFSLAEGQILKATFGVYKECELGSLVLEFQLSEKGDAILGALNLRDLATSTPNNFALVTLNESLRLMEGAVEILESKENCLRIVFRNLNIRALFKEADLKDKAFYDLTVYKPLSILAVDDSSLNRLVFKKIFETTQHSLTVVSSATEALNFIECNNPDVIITDICMPEKDGVELVEEIRRMRGEAIPRIIFVSSDRMSLLDRVSPEIEYGFVEKPPKAESLASELYKLGVEILDMDSACYAESLTECEEAVSHAIDWNEIKNSLSCLNNDSWLSLKQRMDIDQLEKFTDELHEFGLRNDCEEICKIAENMKAYLIEFDLASLERVLDSFDEKQS
ncbi:response regulator [Puniceicoccaceae bacterium K14]|nr:response regulator [Puniceicoccaceae bacterium K14]